MVTRLRVGVIGLGRRWAWYRPALAGPRPLLKVRAVCDQVAARAARVARVLGCEAASGPGDLVERPDIDAVLLLDSQWYGLWPLGRGGGGGKPVFCDPPLTRDDEHADSLRRLLQTHPVPVLMALRPALAPAVQRLHP